MPSSIPASAPPERRGTPLLEVRDLQVGFAGEHGDVTAVRGVSFDLAAAEILGLVGESGSGKTLTLLSLLGLVRGAGAKVTGSIRFAGQELVGLPPREWRRLRGRRIAMVFQDPMTALTPVFTIGWQVAEQIRAHTSLTPHAARRRTLELLREVGLPDPAAVAGRYPHQLSGGMRQRAVIAMALSCEPALLLADEPTTALDVTVQAQILELIGRLRQDFGSAVVLVTHDLGVVAETADRVLVMYAGRVAEAASTGALFADPRHPYSWGLLGSAPPLEGPRPRRLPAIPGLPPSPDALPPGCPFEPRCAWSFPACAKVVPPLAGEAGHAAACLLEPASRAGARAAPNPPPMPAASVA